MTITRSPKYPQLSFQDALGRVQKVYNADKWHPTSDETIAQHLGYKGLNGASLGLIATLKRYGMLVSADNGKWRVSEDAVTIIEAPHEEEDWQQAVLRAAFRPKIFGELKEEFGTELPSNATVRHFLIKKKFNPSIVDDVIRVYQETLSYISQQFPNYTEDEEDDDIEMPLSQEVSVEQASIQTPLTSATSQLPSDSSFTVTEKFEQRISSECRVVVLYEGRVTKEAIQKLQKYLQLSEDEYPSSDRINQISGQSNNPAQNLPNPE